MVGSGVGDQIDVRHPVLVLHELLLVESVEMLREGLCHHSLGLGFAGLGAACQLEGLVDCLIGGLEFETLRQVVRHSNKRLKKLSLP